MGNPESRHLQEPKGHVIVEILLVSLQGLSAWRNHQTNLQKGKEKKKVKRVRATWEMQI